MREVNETLNSKKKNYGNLSLIASVSFLIGACAWFFQAINHLDIVYVILAIANAILSGVNLYLYKKTKSNRKVNSNLSKKMLIL